MVCKETLYTLDEKGQPVWHTPADVQDGVSKLNGKMISVGRVEKMSKSKLNGVDPNAIIAEYGADSARLFTLFAAPPENDLVWKDEGVEGVHRFLNRLWNMIGQRLEAIRSAAPYDGDGAGLDEATAELRRQTHKTIKAVTEDVDQRYRFNTAIARCMELVNALSKFEAPATGGPAASVQRDAFTALVGMLSPFAPHIAEELWKEVGGEGLASEAKWPSFDPAVAADDTITIAVQVSGKLRATLDVERGIANDALERLALENENVRKHIAGKAIRKVIVVPGKLVNVVAG
jgi:leucyl-tRNA synthetase